MKHLIVLTLLFITSIGSADHKNAFLQWGVASNHPGTKNASDVKFGEIGLSGEQGKLAYTLGLGAWFDSSNYKTPLDIEPAKHIGDAFKNYGEGYAKALKGASNRARSSPFVEMLFGVEPKSKHLYMSYKLGPAIIMYPDALLGSHIQISHELGVGMRDDRDVRVGIVLKHFSNAGLVKPNVGRDFVLLRIEF